LVYIARLYLIIVVPKENSNNSKVGLKIIMVNISFRIEICSYFKIALRIISNIHIINSLH
jgi:hypothetical protein